MFRAGNHPYRMISFNLFPDRRLVSGVRAADASDEEPGEFDIQYSAARAVVLRRLDLAGYTEDEARKSFEEWRKIELKTWDEDAEEGWRTNTANALNRSHMTSGDAD